MIKNGKIRQIVALAAVGAALLAGCGDSKPLPPMTSASSAAEPSAVSSASTAGESATDSEIGASKPQTESAQTASSVQTESASSAASSAETEDAYEWTFVDEDEWDAQTADAPCETEEEMKAFIAKYGGFHHVLFAKASFAADDAAKNAAYEKGKEIFTAISDIILNVDADTPNYYLQIVGMMDMNYATQMQTSRTASMYPCLLEYGDFHVDGEPDMLFVSATLIPDTETVCYEMMGNVPCRLAHEGKDSDVIVNVHCTVTLYPDGTWKPVSYGEAVDVANKDVTVQAAFADGQRRIPTVFSGSHVRLNFDEWSQKDTASAIS